LCRGSKIYSDQDSPMKRFLNWLAYLSLFGVGDLPAQELRGLVRDSVSRQPIAGAVLELRDTANRLLGRNLTNERGEFRLSLAGVPEQTSIRIVRLGFRPKTLALPKSTELDVQMQRIPQMLDPITAIATSCPRRADLGSAMALLEQLRAGLLSSIVGREKNPARLTRVAYERITNLRTDSIMRFAVRIDSVNQRATSFQAIRAGAEFVEQGFLVDSSGIQTYLGPDAETLVDDGFIAGYCFHVVRPPRERKNQVGLGFGPAKTRRGRIDVEGTLWVDTAARQLRDLEFRYRGLDLALDTFDLGGRLSFVELRTGAVLVDRWNLRLIAERKVTTPARSALSGVTQRNVIPTLDLHETGGELARARWPDGVEWFGALGSLRATGVRSDGNVAQATSVRLADTDFRARTDAQGRFEFRYLVPGPYQLEILDPHLAAVDVAIPTALRFTAARDSVHRTTLVLRTAQEYVADRCLAERRLSSLLDTTFVLARVFGPDDEPVARARGTVSVKQIDASFAAVDAPYLTGTNGLFQFCNKHVQIGSTIRVSARADGYEPAEVEVIVRESPVVVRLQLTRKP
jgi:hypothetical protein